MFGTTATVSLLLSRRLHQTSDHLAVSLERRPRSSLRLEYNTNSPTVYIKVQCNLRECVAMNLKTPLNIVLLDPPQQSNSRRFFIILHHDYVHSLTIGILSIPDVLAFLCPKMTDKDTHLPHLPSHFPTVDTSKNELWISRTLLESFKRVLQVCVYTMQWWSDMENQSLSGCRWEPSHFCLYM